MNQKLNLIYKFSGLEATNSVGRIYPLLSENETSILHNYATASAQAA